jgi:hypothetical protein
MAGTEDVENAAMFYYQALAQCPDYETLRSNMSRRVLGEEGFSEDVSQSVRWCVKEHRVVIELVEAGSRAQECNWEIAFPYRSNLKHFTMLHSRTILFLVAADAQILQDGGNYRGAFERLLTLRRFAAHMADDPNLGFMVPYVLEGKAIDFVHRMLEVMSPEEDVLVWLGEQLAFDSLSPAWVLKLRRRDFKRTRHMLRTDAETLTRIRTLVPTNSSTTYRARKEGWSSLSDDELIRLICKAYEGFLEDAAEILADHGPRAEARAALDDLVKGFTDEVDDPAKTYWAGAEDALRQYDSLLLHEAALNATRSAVEIYRIVASEGQLPEVLPGGLPRDPYSGEPFVYDVAPDGFTLSCRVKPGDRDKVFTFEFGLSQEAE